MNMTFAGATQICQPVNMMIHWRPILVFQNGKKKHESVVCDHIVGGGREKDGHDWQQGEDGFEYLMRNFTQPNDLVVEPFCGAGTVLKVAEKLNRRCIGAEIDEKTYNIAKARLASNEILENSKPTSEVAS